MAEFPALPIWTSNYMLDCHHLSDAEHGRYFLLLMLIWKSPNCRIPNDEEWIARQMTRSVEAYQKEIIPIIKEFCQTTGNWITQKKLQKEYNFLKLKSKTQSVRAKSRWNKDKDIYPKDAKSMPEECRSDAPTPTPTPTPTPIESSPTPSPDAFDKFDAALRRIPGIEKHPVFAAPVIAPIWQLGQQGYDLKRQIIPSIARQVTNNGNRRITNWGYFVPGIIEDNSSKTNGSHAPAADEKKWAERIEWARKNQQWGIVWGPMPGQQGCGVPANLLRPEDGEGWTEWKASA